MTIYFDENFPPAIAKGMSTIQAGSGEQGIAVRTLVDDHRGVPDSIWLTRLQPDSVVVTQDINIHRGRAHREIYRSQGIVLVVVKPPKAGLRYWDMVNVIIKHWPAIKEVGADVRPAAYTLELTSRKLRPL